MLRNPISPLDPMLPTAASDLPDPDLPDPDNPAPDLPDPDLPGDPPDSPIIDPDVPVVPPVIDPPADQPRMDHAGDKDSEPEVIIRPDAPDQMDLPPKDWDIIDEENDESFPASDPPGNY